MQILWQFFIKCFQLNFITKQQLSSSVLKKIGKEKKYFSCFSFACYIFLYSLSKIEQYQKYWSKMRILRTCDKTKQHSVMCMYYVIMIYNVIMIYMWCNLHIVL